MSRRERFSAHLRFKREALLNASENLGIISKLEHLTMHSDIFLQVVYKYQE